MTTVIMFYTVHLECI